MRPESVAPPVELMLAKLANEVPEGDFLYEPKWDAFGRWCSAVLTISSFKAATGH
jgi:hypothetical protein